MARIRILELPGEIVGEVLTTPFVVVIDRIDRTDLKAMSGETVCSLPSGEFAMIEEMVDDLKATTGARGVIVFAGELEVG